MEDYLDPLRVGNRVFLSWEYHAIPRADCGHWIYDDGDSLFLREMVGRSL